MAHVGLAVPAVERQSFTYTACYCEENVFHLLKRLIGQERRRSDHLYAVFISNHSETVPFWLQQASRQPDKLVIWDYHVVVLDVCSPAAGPCHIYVWDLDTLLPFPCTLEQYAEHALQARAVVLPPQFARCYRIVSADQFLRGFASDRTHMLLADGSWSAPPPNSACIVAEDGCKNNLHCYRDMKIGLLCDENSDNTEAAKNRAPGQQTGNSQGHHQHHQHPAGHTSGTTRERQNEAASWQVISALAGSQRYGVVVTEQQLLTALGLSFSS